MSIVEQKSSLPASGFTALALVSLIVLSGCATTPSYHGVPGKAPGSRVSPDSHYNSGTMKPYTVRGETYYPKVPDAGDEQTGIASWYGAESPNAHTADGELFVPDGISAAHKTFPLPSIAEVTNLDNGKTIRVRVNDRGPFTDNRILDLSRGAARALGVTGMAKVRITWLGPADAASAAPVYVAPAPAPAPAAVADTGDDAHYIVQLGAFSQKDNAARVQDQIDDAHIDKRGSLYVVYLGPFRGAAAAETHRQDAIDAGFSDAVLKRND